MDHSWGPRPIQGKICPTCSSSHFPFCPPPPFPSRYPNYDPNRGPMKVPQPGYQVPGDPYHDPGYWNRNPNLPQMGDYGTASRAPYAIPNHGYGDAGYGGSEYNVNDRSSKRLRVDGTPYGSGDGGVNSGNLPWNEDERRLKLVRDHGAPGSCPIEGREPGNMTNGGVRNGADPGYGLNYQKEELQYQPGYGLNHGVKRSASGVEHGYMGSSKFQNHEHQLPPYGNVARPPENQRHGYHHPNYGSPNISKENFYGSKVQPMPSENASLHYDQRSNVPMGYGYHSPSHFSDVRQPLEPRPPSIEGYQRPFGNQSSHMQPNYGPIPMDNLGDHGIIGHWRASQGYDVRPPLPTSPPPPPPPPLPMEPRPPSPPRVSSTLFPIPVSPSTAVQSSYAPVAEPHMRAHPHPHPHGSHLAQAPRGMFHGDSQATFTSTGRYLGEAQPFPSKNSLPDKPETVNAAQLFKPPHRASRPDHFVIILRGLPGSGKSYLAKMLRDLELEHGGNAPRIHSMDDYFMTEVEKAEENDASKSSMRGKKPTMKKVLEYCYEPEMEEAYRSSMLKAFKKTLDEGVFTFVIVDDRNLRVADFAQFWATAKRSGYEVYILEAPYKDPVGCTARNVHGFSQDDVEKMAAQWEEAPSMYLQLDVKSLFHGDDLKDSNIQEVDMDTEDGDFDGDVSRLEERAHETSAASTNSDLRHDEAPHDESGSDAEEDNPVEVKDLGRSKWSDNLDDEDDGKTESFKGKPNVFSGLLKTYEKGGKSVHWGDKGGYAGFSIGAVKRANMVSLVIGPGVGYNLKTNPLREEDAKAAAKPGETKSHSVFKERLRAEQESFKAIFDRRRQRIGGFDADEE